MGKYGITSQSQIIDRNTILAGCKKLEEAGDLFEKYGNEFSAVSSVCNETALSVGKESFTPAIDELGQTIAGLKTVLYQKSNDIANSVNAIYADQNQEYQDYLDSLKSQTTN